MSLLQIGGRESIWRAIGDVAGLPEAEQSRLVLEGPLGSELETSKNSINQLSLNGSAQQILIHRLTALRLLGKTPEDRATWLRQAAKAGHSLHFYSYDEFTEAWEDQDVELLTQSNFKSICLGSPYLAERAEHWCSMPCAVKVNKIEPQFRTPKPQQVHVLYLAHQGGSAEAQHIAETFSALKNSGLKFSASVFGANEVQSFEEIEALVGACDLFIEQLTHSYFGSLALFAMAKGKPVISRNCPNNQNFAHQFSLSPVLDASVDTLYARLQAIIREPICLRDLNKRSRQYVETYHNADLIYAGLFDSVLG